MPSATLVDTDIHPMMLEGSLAPRLSERWRRHYRSRLERQRRDAIPWLYRHFRATTQPAHLPKDPSRVAEAAEMIRAPEFLMYASDHPHDHGPGADLLLVLDDSDREAVLEGNASELYSL